MDSYSTTPTNGEGKPPFGYKKHKQVQGFLAKLHLEQYIPIFLDEGFESLQAVKEITEEDLIALNVKRGHRRVIQRGIATLNGVPQNQPLMVSSTTNAPAVATSPTIVQQQQPSTIMRSTSNNGNNSSEGSSYTTSGYGSMNSPRHQASPRISSSSNQQQQQQQYESSNSSGTTSSSSSSRHHLHIQQEHPIIIQQVTQLQSSQPRQTRLQQAQSQGTSQQSHNNNNNKNGNSNGVTIVDETRSSSFSSNDEEDNDDDDVNTPLKRKYRRHPKPDKNAPIKPPSAYIMFSNDARARLKDHNMTFVEIAKLVGDQWKNLSMHQKQQYERTAMRAKDDYIDALNAYRQTDEYKNYQIYLNNFKSEQDATNRKIARLRKRAKRESPGSGSMADSSSNGNDNSNIKNRRSDGSLGSSNSTDGGSNEADNARSSSSSGSTDIYKVHLKNNSHNSQHNNNSHPHHHSQPLSSSIATKTTSSREEGGNNSGERSQILNIHDLSDRLSPINNNNDMEEDEGNGDECYSPQQKAPPLVTDDNLIQDYHRIPSFKSSNHKNQD